MDCEPGRDEFPCCPTLLFQAMCGSRRPPTSVMDATCADLARAAGDRWTPALQARVRACLRAPQVREACKTIAALQAAVGDAFWRRPHTAHELIPRPMSLPLWSDHRRRMTNDWNCYATATVRTLQVFRIVAKWLAGVSTLPGAIAITMQCIRPLCKPLADALSPGAVMVTRGLPPAAHGPFLLPDEHGVAAWVRLALRQGVWVQPAPPSVPIPVSCEGVDCVWAVVQWATTRCYLCLQGGFVLAVFTLHRCVPAPDTPGFPCVGAAVEVNPATASTTVKGAIRQRLTVEAFEPKQVLVILWGTPVRPQRRT